jgi:coenzyme F420 hydrogenase subunit beta
VSTQQVDKPKIFGNLLTEVIRTNLCVGCGGCAAVCPVDIIQMNDELPTMMGKCILCEYCYFQCPVTDTSIEDIETKIFGRSRTTDESFGIYQECYSAKTKLYDIAQVGQDGGIVTSLLSYALQKKEKNQEENEYTIDCAVVSGVSDKIPWKAVPKVAVDQADLLKNAGTRYTTNPTMLGLYSAVVEYGMNNVALVGTPCQVKALRKTQTHNHGALKLGDKVSLVIGLFCMESFNYSDLIENFIVKQKNIDLNKIAKFQIKKGKFKVETDGETRQEVVNVPISEVKPYARSSCHICNDLTAEFADISVGSIGSPEGWSTVIIRSKKGKAIFEEACDAGFLEKKPLDEVKPGLKVVEKISTIKSLQGKKSDNTN